MKHFRPAQLLERGKKVPCGSALAYMKRLPFRMPVILWVSGCRIFSYFRSLVKLKLNLLSIFITSPSSTDRGTPFTVIFSTFSSGLDNPAEKGFVSYILTFVFRISKPSHRSFVRLSWEFTYNLQSSRSFCTHLRSDAHNEAATDNS